MKQFVLLYTGGGMAETDAEKAAVMRAWGEWFGSVGSNLIDNGTPFIPNVKTVASDGTITDSPIGVLATGYTIVAAESLDHAAQIAKHCPVLQGGGKITVYEKLPVM